MVSRLLVCPTDGLEKPDDIRKSCLMTDDGALSSNPTKAGVQTECTEDYITP